MASGWMDLVSRPLKIAFVVNPADRAAVQRAISINSVLWGGIFNPIIPAFGRTPKNWRWNPGEKINATQMLDGYIEAFDPDFICPMGECATRSFKHYRQPILAEVAIFPKPDDLGSPLYGIGIRSVADFIFNTEFKYSRIQPINIVSHRTPPKDRLYLSAIHGCLEEDNILRIFGELTKLDCFSRVTPTIIKRLYQRDQNFLDLMTLNTLNIKWNSVGNAQDSPVIYVMNPRETLDVIDFWNLRSLGWQLIPTPIGNYSDLDFRLEVKALVAESHRPLPGNNNGVYLNALVQAGRSIKPDVFDEVTKSLSMGAQKDKDGQNLYVSRHYPRIWSPDYRDADRSECPEFYESTKNIAFDDNAVSLTIPAHAPRFLRQGRPSLKPRFANTLRPKVFSESESLAEVIPPGNEDYTRAIGLAGWKEWHASNHGLVFIAHSDDQSVYLPLASLEGEKILGEYLKVRGLSLTPSSAGRMARLASQSLGSLLFSGGISSKSLINELIELAKSGYKLADAFSGNITKALKNTEYPWDRDRVIKELVERNVISLGLAIKCNTCGRESWYAIKQIDEKVHCVSCTTDFLTPTHDTKKLKWAYKTLGPFSGKNSADGIYPVLFTQRCLKRSLGLSVTACLSSEYTIDDSQRELDGVFLIERTIWGVGARTLCFLEAKTGNGFTAKEIRYMKDLGNKFPRSTLIFATLSDEIAPKEQRLLRSLVCQNMELRRKRRPYNDVLIITGTELFASINLHHTWEKKGGRHKDIAARTAGRFWQLADICEATNELYLGTPSFFLWCKQRAVAKKRS